MQSLQVYTRICVPSIYTKLIHYSEILYKNYDTGGHINLVPFLFSTSDNINIADARIWEGSVALAPDNFIMDFRKTS